MGATDYILWDMRRMHMRRTVVPQLVQYYGAYAGMSHEALRNAATSKLTAEHKNAINTIDASNLLKPMFPSCFSVEHGRIMDAALARLYRGLAYGACPSDLKHCIDDAATITPAMNVTCAIERTRELGCAIRPMNTLQTITATALLEMPLHFRVLLWDKFMQRNQMPPFVNLLNEWMEQPSHGVGQEFVLGREGFHPVTKTKVTTAEPAAFERFAAFMRTVDPVSLARDPVLLGKYGTPGQLCQVDNHAVGRGEPRAHLWVYDPHGYGCEEIYLLGFIWKGAVSVNEYGLYMEYPWVNYFDDAGEPIHVFNRDQAWVDMANARLAERRSKQQAAMAKEARLLANASKKERERAAREARRARAQEAERERVAEEARAAEEAARVEKERLQRQAQARRNRTLVPRAELKEVLATVSVPKSEEKAPVSSKKKNHSKAAASSPPPLPKPAAVASSPPLPNPATAVASSSTPVFMEPIARMIGHETTAGLHDRFPVDYIRLVAESITLLEEFASDGEHNLISLCAVCTQNQRAYYSPCMGIKCGVCLPCFSRMGTRLCNCVCQRPFHGGWVLHTEWTEAWRVWEAFYLKVVG